MTECTVLACIVLGVEGIVVVRHKILQGASSRLCIHGAEHCVQKDMRPRLKDTRLRLRDMQLRLRDIRVRLWLRRLH